MHDHAVYFYARHQDDGELKVAFFNFGSANLFSDGIFSRLVASTFSFALISNLLSVDPIFSSTPDLIHFRFASIFAFAKPDVLT